MIALAATVIAAICALLALVWLLTRNPSRDRELIDARTDLTLARDLIARLHQEALRSADVDPVAPSRPRPPAPSSPVPGPAGFTAAGPGYPERDKITERNGNGKHDRPEA